MIRFLPFILILALILGGLGYWRYSTSKLSLTTPQTDQKTTQETTPIEVPKTLPQASVEDRVKTLEDLVAKLVTQVNSLKSNAPQTQSDSSVSSKLDTLNSSVTELKVRVSALEKATPTPAVATSSQSTVYIPLGSGGYWEKSDWYAAPEYEISLDPSNYPGYTGMILEVTLRVIDSSDKGSIRLYNMSDSSATSSQVDTSSSSFVLQTSSSFKLPTGTKTYRLQVKSSQGKGVFIQSARIKVNF